MTENIPNITPFFILQYVDQRSGTYRGYVVSAKARKNDDNEIIYDYKIDTNVFRHGWKIVDQFYALNPLFRPIPTGMNLYCVEHSSSAPMKISAFYKDYDIFDVNRQNCTFFIAYGQPVVNTTSLYFHDMGEDGLFPTFARDPPSGKGKWSNVKFSPVFVMTSFSQMKSLRGIDSKYDESIRFRCLNKKCVPWTDKQSDMFRTEDLLSQESIPIFDCVVSCNQNLIDEEIDKDTIDSHLHSPKSIFGVVKNYSTKHMDYELTENVMNPLLGLIVITFAISAFIIISVALRSSKK